MTGPHSGTESRDTRPISVAELLARNGTIGAPAVTRRRRRRRGDSDAVTVAELTGEIPVIRDDHHEKPEHHAGGAVQLAEPAPPAHPGPVSEQRVSSEIEEILEIISNPENQPVFIHCKRGCDRTGTVSAAYRIKFDGWTAEEARREAKERGIGWWQMANMRPSRSSMTARSVPAAVLLLARP